jgi:hypothetical protein
MAIDKVIPNIQFQQSIYWVSQLVSLGIHRMALAHSEQLLTSEFILMNLERKRSKHKLT